MTAEQHSKSRRIRCGIPLLVQSSETERVSIESYLDRYGVSWAESFSTPPHLSPSAFTVFTPGRSGGKCTLYSVPVPRFPQGSIKIAIDWNQTKGLSNVDGMQIVFFVVCMIYIVISIPLIYTQSRNNDDVLGTSGHDTVSRAILD